MRVTLDWAIFASAPHQGHGLRDASLARQEVPSELSNFSDLPGGSEGATDWVPYHSGRAFGETFAFTYTESDTSVGRAGRVRTRVFLFSRTIAEQINDIRPILEALKTHPVFVEGGCAIELEFPDTPLPAGEHVSQILSTFAAYPENRAVFVGQEQAEQAIPAVWSALWPAARGAFSFRLHFDPHELPTTVEVPPMLVVTPSGRRRWTGGPTYVVIGVQPVEQRPIIEHLCGNSRGTAQEILDEVDTDDVRQLAQLNNFMLDLEEAREQSTVTPIAATLALLDVVALKPTYKEQLHSELYGYLLARLDNSEGNEVRRLAGIAVSDRRVRVKVTEWARRLLDDRFAKNVVAALKQGQSWFCNAVAAGLKQASPDANQAERVWELWELLDGEKLLDALINPGWDEHLAATIPPQVPTDANDVAVRRGWWTLSTTLASRQGDEAQALQDVMATVPETFALQALTLLQELWGDRRFLYAVVRAGDSRTYEEGSRALARVPEMLAGLDVDNDAWLSVWTRTLPKVSDIWAGVPDPTGHVFALLNRLRAKRSVPTDILEAVSRTDAAAIVDYPERRTIWALVPSGFLMCTARAIFARDQDPGELEQALLNEAIATLDEKTPSNMVAQRLLLQTEASIPEFRLRQLLASIGDDLGSKHVPVLEARMISSPDLLSSLFDHGLANDPRLPPAFLQHFRQSLSPLRQVRLADHLGDQVEREVWWRAVQELMTEIYPEGPHVIWELIGGKKKHLVQSGTGEYRWAEALQHIRARGKPEVGHLLAQAGRDYRLSDATSVLWRQR